MAITITNLVGPKPQGVNLPEDVLTIKKALNSISTLQGGLKDSPPTEKLDETNGILDQKTLNAIQKFQIKHFGWSGADCKIYPNSVTIGKINELLPAEEKPAETEAKTNIFFLMISPARHIIFGDVIYLKFDDIQNRQSAKYKVDGAWGYVAPDQKPQVYTNQQRILWQGLALSVKAFDNADFQFGTAARNQIDPNAQFQIPTIVTENMMGIKTVNDNVFRYFYTRDKPSLEGVTSQALVVGFTDKWDELFTGKIVGKLSLVEFESW